MPGPAANLPKLWATLRKGHGCEIEMSDPSPLGKYLGRGHRLLSNDHPGKIANGLMMPIFATS